MTAATFAPASTRAAFSAGLRRLADLLDSHADILPLPIDGHSSPLLVMFGDDEDEALEAAAALLGCDRPTIGQGSHGVLYGLEGRVEGLRVKLCRYAEAGDRKPVAA